MKALSRKPWLWLVRRIAPFLAALMLPYSTLLAQTDSAEPDTTDWPCIQALVPELSPVVVWPEYIEESDIGSWRKDTDIKRVVNKFGQLEVFTDDDRQGIADYAEAIPEEQRLQTLNSVADGILYRFNQRRTHYIKGIKKYSRQQSAVALQIEDFLNQKAELESSTAADAKERIAELDATARWHQRIFDQRENAITPLCDAPVELETLLGDVLREFAQYLP